MFVLFILGIAGMIFVWSVTAGADPLPTRPSGGDTPNSGGMSAEVVDAPRRGANILLSVDYSNMTQIMPDSNDWTVVQWQDKGGTWRDVDGWQGHFMWDSTEKVWEVQWWVDQDEFGQGPFRWVVYNDRSRNRIEAVSVPFDLPESKREQVTIGLLK